MHISRSGQKISFDVNQATVEELITLKQELGDKFPKFGILVLSYNASDFLEKTIDRIPKEVSELIEEIFIFDDNSPDKTYEIAKSFSGDNFWKDKLNIFKNSTNLRYGGNQKVGYQYAIDKGLDYVIMLHGDGQYAPEYIPDLMLPAVKAGHEVVFASRMINKRDALKGGMPFYKFIGNQVLTRFENLILNTSLYEFHSGYRMYSTKVLRSIPLNANTNEFHFDTQIIIQCRHLGINIKEVPIKTFYGDEECNVDGFRYAFDVCKSVMKYRMHQLHLIREGSYIFDQDAVYTRKKSPNSSHSKILKLLKPNSKILSVENGHNILSSAIRDLNQELVTIKLEEKNFDTIEYEREFDCIVLADVLNKLSNPKKSLEVLSRYLKEDGRLIVSVPNIVMWFYRLSVLIGRFNYAPRGALDKNNLRFYTRFSIVQLLGNCGYEIEKIEPTSIPFEIAFASSGKSNILKLVDKVYYVLAKNYQKLFSYEFVISAKITSLDYRNGEGKVN